MGEVSRRIRSQRAAWSAALIAIALLAGCGDDGERQFTPVSFISEVNAQGAALNLGSVLTTSEAGVDVYTVTFAALAPPSTGEGRSSATRGSGTLLVLENADAARTEYERCTGAPVLTCFRAANAVLRFEDLEPADQARLVTALEALETVSGLGN